MTKAKKSFIETLLSEKNISNDLNSDYKIKWYTQDILECQYEPILNEIVLKGKPLGEQHLFRYCELHNINISKGIFNNETYFFNKNNEIICKIDNSKNFDEQNEDFYFNLNNFLLISI